MFLTHNPRYSVKHGDERGEFQCDSEGIPFRSIENTFSFQQVPVVTLYKFEWKPEIAMAAIHSPLRLEHLCIVSSSGRHAVGYKR